MKPFLFSHGDKEAAGARELSAAELEIVSGGDDATEVGDVTQVMTANKDPAGPPIVRDGYDG